MVTEVSSNKRVESRELKKDEHFAFFMEIQAEKVALDKKIMTNNWPSKGNILGLRQKVSTEKIIEGSIAEKVWIEVKQVDVALMTEDARILSTDTSNMDPMVRARFEPQRAGSWLRLLSDICFVFILCVRT